jgi:hypothetical protein
MEKREERIRLETSRFRVTGTMTFPAGGYRSRLSDSLNAPEREFISLTDVTLEPLNGGGAEQHPFVVVGRRHVVLAALAQTPDS